MPWKHILIVHVDIFYNYKYFNLFDYILSILQFLFNNIKPKFDKQVEVVRNNNMKWYQG